MMRPLVARWIDRGARLLAAAAGALALALGGAAVAQEVVAAAPLAASAAALPVAPQNVLADAAPAAGASLAQIDAAAPGAPAMTTPQPRPVAAALALLGVVVLAIGWLNTRRSDLLYLGLLALGAAALAAGDWLGAAMLPAGRADWLGHALAPLVAACAVLFLMRYAGLRARAFDAALLAQCVIVPASLLLAGPQRLPGLAHTWHALLALEVLIAAGVMLWRARRLRPREFWILCGLCGVMAAAIVIDLAQRQHALDAGLLTFTGWLDLVLPLAFIALGLRLVYSEVVGLRLADAHARTMLDRRVGEAAADAERNFAQLAELRVEQVTEKERKRIAADLHDDLGAKLLTIVHTSESERISTLAREALEEMRLSVHGLTGKPVRLADALADWRAETVSRLGQANIEREWQSPTEETEHLLPSRGYRADHAHPARGGQQHHQAQRRDALHACAAASPDGDFALTIQDNGHGIPMELDGKLDRGHGMSSMKHRAKQMQGQCLVESGPRLRDRDRVSRFRSDRRALARVKARRRRTDSIEGARRADRGPRMNNVLLLEDLPEIRAWLKALVLQVFPHSQIFEAARVHDALELVSAIKFDLALIDLGLPDGSGVDVVARAARGAARGAVGGGDDPRRRRAPLPGAAGRRLRLPAEGAGRAS